MSLHPVSAGSTSELRPTVEGLPLWGPPAHLSLSRKDLCVGDHRNTEVEGRWQRWPAGTAGTRCAGHGDAQLEIQRSSDGLHKAWEH